MTDTLNHRRHGNAFRAGGREMLECAKAELFARQPRPGWTTIGNQLPPTEIAA